MFYVHVSHEKRNSKTKLWLCMRGPMHFAACEANSVTVLHNSCRWQHRKDTRSKQTHSHTASYLYLQTTVTAVYILPAKNYSILSCPKTCSTKIIIIIIFMSVNLESKYIQYWLTVCTLYSNTKNNSVLKHTVHKNDYFCRILGSENVLSLYVSIHTMINL